MCALNTLNTNARSAFTVHRMGNVKDSVINLMRIEGTFMGLKPGTKFDTDKVRTDLLPVTALLNAAEVFTFGAKKYGDKNWEKGIKNSRLYGACLRHLFAHMQGETLDPESNLPHIYHALACLLMLSDNYSNRPEMDDRKGM